jgi:2-keto-4-pentenoate hydratase/2-oxohepta-3-ene-1,7-dioic acid hydratase in catechol pathway
MAARLMRLYTAARFRFILAVIIPNRDTDRMLLVTFSDVHGPRIGILGPKLGALVDLAAAAPNLPRDMLRFIAAGEEALATARQAQMSGKGHLMLDQVRLLAPIPRPPRNILCVGKNYRDHVREVQPIDPLQSAASIPMPELPIFFTKATSSVIGPGETIPAHLDPTNSTDYEGELAVIIGKSGRTIPRSNAFDHVFGYTILNDVTSRRLQKRHQQWFLGKSIDGFCPLGPAIVTRDAIPDAGMLHIQTRVNNEIRQDGHVSEMIFDIPTLIETLSRTMSLEPGDIIATGTPAGVGLGFNPPKFLQRGDKVSITIEPIGTLENSVS